MLTTLRDIFFEPKMAFIIFTIFIAVYLIGLDEEGAFTEKFFRFGPSEESKFLNMNIDTWQKVILVYTLSFMSSVLTAYYRSVSFDFIHSYIWNPAYKEKIKMSKAWTTAIVAFEPLLFWILNIIDFFVTLTMEFQYILPKFLGQIAINVPYGIYKVNQKEYTS